jgi:GntR family transcriptional regulator/MocR family aminotransferase
MEMHVDLIDRKDLSGEIYRQLKRAMADGRLRPGDALPPTRELARSLMVSRTTVSVAYERLAGDGFVTSRVGAGTFVSEHAALPKSANRVSEAGVLRPQPVWASIDLPTTFDKPARFNFRTGLPSLSIFPHQTWQRLIRQSLRPSLAAAGVYQEPGGHRRLREAIAWHVGTSRGVSAVAEDITITNGAQQALDVLARALLAPGDRIAVEDPGYGLPRHLFRSHGIEVVGIPVDREGLVVDAIGPDVRAVYATPSHQYPLGVTMSLARRRSLLSWAELHNAAIIEDDYDGEFRFGGRPVDALQTLDSYGRVVYVGSFSKVMLPTLRLGFVITPPSLSRAMQAAKYVSDWGTSLLTQDALASFIEEGGFARHVRRAGAAYLRRHDLVVITLRRDFGEYLEVLPSNAGLHLTALAKRLSPGDINTVTQRAVELGVALHPLSMFSEDIPLAGIALGYGAIEIGEIEEGLRRLKLAFMTDPTSPPLP